jgi:hypothetical protein
MTSMRLPRAHLLQLRLDGAVRLLARRACGPHPLIKLFAQHVNRNGKLGVRHAGRRGCVEGLHSTAGVFTQTVTE